MMRSLRTAWRWLIGWMALGLAVAVLAGEKETWVTARWVIDGDTIVLHDGRRVRYLGLDAPEIDHRHGRAQPMGYDARATNRHLVEGWQLRLVVGEEGQDRYGRTLAYVHRRDGLFVNAALLRRGCAYYLPNPATRDQSDDLLAAQREAMQQGLGLWREVKRNEIPSQAYLGNRQSRRFHAHHCPMAKKIAPRNRVWLYNRWSAFWQGYAPDRGCIVFPEER